MRGVLQPCDVPHSLTAAQELLDSLDSDLKYVIEVEGKLSLDNIGNYDEVRAEIAQGLENLRDVPNRRENPLIYHLDVAAMYPNIILTNRCQKSCLCAQAILDAHPMLSIAVFLPYLGHFFPQFQLAFARIHFTSMAGKLCMQEWNFEVMSTWECALQAAAVCHRDG